MIKTFINSDGGRKESNHPNEKLDCAVRAYALAYDKSYNEAHELFKKYGRQDRHKSNNTVKTLESVGTQIEFVHDSLTVNQFIESHPSGHYILKVRGHVFAVKHGMIWDEYIKPKAKVKWIAKIYTHKSLIKEVTI